MWATMPISSGFLMSQFAPLTTRLRGNIVPPFPIINCVVVAISPGFQLHKARDNTTTSI